MSAHGGPILGETFHRLPLTQRTLPRVLELYAARHGDRHFATLPGADLTFAAAPLLAARAAGMFESLGLQKTECVALLLSNRVEFIASVWGQAWRGAVSAPLNPALKGPALLHALKACGAKALVVEADKLEDVAAVADDAPMLTHIIVAGERPASSRHHSWDELYLGAKPAPAADVAFRDPLAIMFTSGTTGAAKGVVVSHHHYYCYAAPNVDNHAWGPEDHLYTPLPLCHASAHMSLFMPAFMAGARVTLASRFSASRFWSDVAACGATHVSLMGAMGNILARQPPSPADRAHNVRTLAVSPPPQGLPAFEARFGVKVLWQAYGQTEGYYNQRMLDQPAKARDCVGRTLPLFEMAVLDENDAALPHDGDATGEIAVRPRAPFAMATHYFNDPAATVAAFRNQWFHTGDLGAIDADGFVYLRGRKKDAIRRRGENVSAAEVEAAALAHPEVAQAAAFALPSDLGEDDIKLDVVLTPSATLSAAELARFMSASLARYMRPRYIQIRDALPMTASHRVEKYRLREEGAANAHYDSGDGAPRRALT